jgi:hypothetical protein
MKPGIIIGKSMQAIGSSTANCQTDALGFGELICRTGKTQGACLMEAWLSAGIIEA